MSYGLGHQYRIRLQTLEFPLFKIGKTKYSNDVKYLSGNTAPSSISRRSNKKKTKEGSLPDRKPDQMLSVNISINYVISSIVTPIPRR